MFILSYLNAPTSYYSSKPKYISPATPLSPPWPTFNASSFRISSQLLSIRISSIFLPVCCRCLLLLLLLLLRVFLFICFSAIEMATSPAGRMLTRQFQQMQSDNDSIPGISCGLVDNNVFEWEVMLMISDDVKLYGGKCYF